MTVTEEMKGYERLARTSVSQRSYVMVRVDGKAFHTFTKGMDRPCDTSLIEAMNAAADALCKQVDGAVMAYTQSDEISVLFTDLRGENTHMWFSGQVQKIVSVTASIATAAFNMALQPDEFALFDSRVFVLPDVETVQRYFGWRQRDCIKNSIAMTAQSYFSHKQLLGKNTNEVLDMLADRQPEAPDWYALPRGFQIGRMTCRETWQDTTTYTHRKTGEVITVPVQRSQWVTRPAELFDEDGNWIGPTIPRRS